MKRVVQNVNTRSSSGSTGLHFTASRCQMFSSPAVIHVLYSDGWHCIVGDLLLLFPWNAGDASRCRCVLHAFRIMASGQPEP